MDTPTEPKRYHIYLDYKGYMIDPVSYRAYPAPLMGTKFATGRMAYSNLDFWQIGAMTDFSKGMNQKYQNDPSQYYASEGIDVSTPGELRLERDLVPFENFPTDRGRVTARYRSRDYLYLGTDMGWVIRTSNGETFEDVLFTGGGKIYGFYEFEEPVEPEDEAKIRMQREGVPDGWTILKMINLYITKGPYNCWKFAGKTVRGPQNEGAQPGYIERSYELGGTNGFLEVKDLYYVMSESDYLYGLFNDGVRQSTDGETWIPAPPDPLWSLPDSEGEPLNAVAIPRGFVIGARRGLYIFVGGGSGLSIWDFPDYSHPDNFKGMAKIGAYALCSVEGQGLFYTDGAQAYPTSMAWISKPKSIISCAGAIYSGWDAFALVKDSDNNWYLARCNMTYQTAPNYWWMVKKLSKTPCYISSFSHEMVLVHYEDGTCESYNKDSGPYQKSGSLETSLVDEALVLLQKMYNSIFAISSYFPKETSLKLGYRLRETETYRSKEFISDGSAGTGEITSTYILPNPTRNERIQIKIELGTDNVLESPIITDLCWKYILGRPKETTNLQRTWSFTVLGEDMLQKYDLNTEELGRGEIRDRQDILDELWEIAEKEEVLNYVGADNIPNLAFRIRYIGRGSSCKIKIDRADCRLTTSVKDADDEWLDFDYREATIEDVIDYINGHGSGAYTCEPYEGIPQNKAALSLMPIKDVELMGDTEIFWGTDVHAAIMMPQSPGQVKLSPIDYSEEQNKKFGNDRMQIALRET